MIKVRFEHKSIFLLDTIHFTIQQFEIKSRKSTSIIRVSYDI